MAWLLAGRRAVTPALGLRRRERAEAVGFVDVDVKPLSSGGADGPGLAVVFGELAPATLPLRCCIRAFCFCFTVIMDRTCSIAEGLSRLIVKPMTTGEMGVEFV